MGLETGTYINDFVTTNPDGADAKSQGDDHLRLIKTLLKATFPGMAGAAWRVQTKSTGYAVVANDSMSVLNCTAGLTLTGTAAATLGNQHMVLVFANGGDVVFDPNAAELVNGAATITIPNGQSAVLVCTGTAFLALLLPGLGAIQTWTGAQTFNDGKLVLAGASSGAQTLKAAAVASTYVATLPAATTTLAGLAMAETFSAPQRGTTTTDNDLSFDLNVTNNFACTPSAGGALTFTNHTAGQSGFILLVNGSNYAITAAATTKVDSSLLATISATGTYLLSYFDNGTNAYVVSSKALS